MYRIEVYKVEPDGGTDEVPLYQQTVEELNLLALITAINRKPRKSRAKAQQKAEAS